MPPVTLVIPVFNERRALPRLAASLDKIPSQMPDGSEILLVDDGSTDGSGDMLRAMESSGAVRIYSHARNRGYGASLKTGIAAARNEWIAIADADGTYPLGALPRLLAAIEAGADMAVGSRPLSSQPLLRRPAKAFLLAFASYLSGTRIPDLNSGLRVFRRADAQRLGRLLPEGFSFTSTITMALLGEGARVDFLPIKYGARVGRSKIRPIRDTAQFFTLVCRMALAFNPLKVFGPMAGLLMAAGAGLLAARLFMDRPAGVATTIIFLVGGLQVLAVGLLADLINRRG
ncbi:glycosyltransferase family 2 protein [Candidatus Poribacteria bacterium]|nr:glycosyltransferase family 2 protein [Candidatus Poribacteria bacterium]